LLLDRTESRLRPVSLYVAWITVCFPLVARVSEAETEVVSPRAFIGERKVALTIPNGWRIATPAPGWHWSEKQEVMKLAPRRDLGTRVRGNLKGDRPVSVSFFNWSGGRALRNGRLRGARLRTHGGLQGILTETSYLTSSDENHAWYFAVVLSDDVFMLRVNGRKELPQHKALARRLFRTVRFVPQPPLKPATK
jgi:hypothetical protein